VELFSRRRLLLAAFGGAAVVAAGATATLHAPTRKRLRPSYIRARAMLSMNLSPWQERLFNPTQVQKIGSRYFIVDCDHNRILVSDDIRAPIKDWQTMDGELSGPHSIAFGHGVYLVDDTGGHRLIAYRQSHSKFDRIATFEEVGRRPHHVIWDDATSSFFAIGSQTPTIIRVEVVGGQPHLAHVVHLEELANCYVRSIAILNGQLAFINSSRRSISFAADYVRGDYSIRRTIPVDIPGLVSVFPLPDGLLISSKHQLVFTQSLETLAAGVHMSMGHHLKLRGTPYYITTIDDRLVIPEIDERSAIHLTRWPMDAALETIHASGPPAPPDLVEQLRLPK
jgi:hypothetical protein